MALITMLSIGEGAKQEMLEQIAQLGTHNMIIRASSDATSFSEKDIKIFKDSIPSLKKISAIQEVTGTVSGFSTPLHPDIVATDRSFADIKKLQVVQGRFLSDIDVKNHHYVCVLGYDFSLQLGVKGHVGQSIMINGIRFLVIGILTPTYWKSSKSVSILARNINTSILIPLSIASSIDQAQRTSYSEIILQTEKTESLHFTKKLANQILLKKNRQRENWQITIPEELLRQSLRTQKNFNIVLGSIATISLLVGGIGIMNVMLATVAERAREIGIRRSLGATQMHILMQFLTETFALTLFGSILGIISGMALSQIICYYAGWKMIVTLWSIVLSLFMSFIVGLCAGIHPAHRAAHISPIDALRNL
jgi:putative ABC transport system permease protein